MAWTPEQKREARRRKAEAEGRTLGDRPGPAPINPCGTPAAYQRHKRRGEPACPACLEAWRNYNRKKS